MSEQNWFSISTDRICEVCGDGAPPLHALIDLNLLPVAACTPCAVRVALRILGASTVDRAVADRAREVLAAATPLSVDA